MRTLAIVALSCAVAFWFGGKVWAWEHVPVCECKETR